MADEGMLVAFRSPYNPKLLVRVPIPSGVTVASLKEASRFAVLALAIIRGKELFSTYPLSQNGAIGILVLSRSMSAEDAKSDDTPASAMLGALSFVRQTLEKLESGVTIPKREFDTAVATFEKKYGALFPKYAAQRLLGLKGELDEKYAKRITRMVEIITETYLKDLEDEDDLEEEKPLKKKKAEVAKEVAKEQGKAKSRSRSREREVEVEKKKSRSREREVKEEKKKSRSRERETAKEEDVDVEKKAKVEKKVDVVVEKKAKVEKKKSRSRSREREEKKVEEASSKVVEPAKKKKKKKEPEIVEPVVVVAEPPKAEPVAKPDSESEEDEEEDVPDIVAPETAVAEPKPTLKEKDPKDPKDSEDPAFK